MGGDIGVARRAVATAHRSQADLAAMFPVALHAAELGGGMAGIHQLGRVRGAIVALRAGLIGHAAEILLVADLAALFENRMCFRERPVFHSAPGAANAEHQRNRRQGRERHENPDEPLAQERQEGWTLQVAEVEPLRHTLGVAQSSLILERLVLFFGHGQYLSDSTACTAVSTRNANESGTCTSSQVCIHRCGAVPEAAAALRRSLPGRAARRARPPA